MSYTTILCIANTQITRIGRYLTDVQTIVERAPCNPLLASMCILTRNLTHLNFGFESRANGLARPGSERCSKTLSSQTSHATFMPHGFPADPTLQW